MDENQREQIRFEREERYGRTQSQKQGKDCFSVVTTAQTILFLLLAVVIIILSKTGGETARKLKSDFNSLMNWSVIENSEDVIQTVKEFFNEPFELLPAFSPIKSVTDESSHEETLQSDSESTDEETTEKIDESEPVSEEATEGLSDNENMGGEDIEIYKAADNTSFSPVVTTCAVVRPVESKKYTSYFGYRINPITNQKSFHTGLDIAAALGTKIRAAYSGTVRKIGEDSRSGKYIFLTHDDGFETFYCHCSEIVAEEGAVIRQGETIAKVGSTGWSTGPHLHFEIRKDGNRLNPLSILENNDN